MLPATGGAERRPGLTSHVRGRRIRWPNVARIAGVAAAIGAAVAFGPRLLGGSSAPAPDPDVGLSVTGTTGATGPQGSLANEDDSEHRGKKNGRDSHRRHDHAAHTRPSPKPSPHHDHHDDDHRHGGHASPTRATSSPAPNPAPAPSSPPAAAAPGPAPAPAPRPQAPPGRREFGP